MHNTLRGNAYQLYKQPLVSPLLKSKTGGVISIFGYGSDLYSAGSNISSSKPKLKDGE